MENSQSDVHDSENLQEEYEEQEYGEEYEYNEEYEDEEYEDGEDFHSDRGDEFGEEEEVFEKVSRSMSRSQSQREDSRMEHSELAQGTKMVNLTLTIQTYEETESAITEEADILPAERLVRMKIFRFINKLRKQYLKPLFYNDLYGNRLSMEYAKHILAFKDNRSDIAGL
jgi:hypothetical protein